MSRENREGPREQPRRRERKSYRPGPIYDRAVRTLVEDNPGAFCDWLEEPHDDHMAVLPSTFVSESLRADFVAKLSADRLLHVEYIREPSRAMAVRMVAYLARLMRAHPGCSITQYALVLARGRLPSVDD